MVHDSECYHSLQTIRAAISDLTDAIFIRNYLIAQGYDIPPVTVYQYNQAAIKLCENGVNSSARTRHIDIPYFLIKDLC